MKLNGGDIDYVVLTMGTKPLDLNCFISENNPHNQPVFIAHDVEYHQVVAYQASRGIDLFQLIKIGKFLACQLGIPLLQGDGRRWV